jgi:mgtE-like transporter
MKNAFVGITAKVFKETLPVVLGATIGELIAGLVLGGMKESLALLPGLIVLIPAVLDLRGCISSALGSRLGSALHLGLVGWDKGMNTELKANIQASLFLSFASGTLAATTQVTITIVVSFTSYGKGIDPDNVTIPAMATIGDILGITYMFLVAILFGGLLI